MSERRFNEGCAVTFTADFRRAGVGYVPTTVEWKLRNATADVLAQDWTSATPAASVDVDISGLLLTIADEARDWETYELTVCADRGLSTQSPEVVLFRVVNVDAL